LAVSLSLVSVFSGLVLAYYFNMAPGGVIVLVALFFLVLTFLFNHHK
ncbi:MAG: metal ABC transporter permease, partial [Candidatus Nealsonbacteria bacterium]|nr:metal ABC transporter permease [Candidatus Nealsonbacteria bacterium]